jgi:antitoxin (DNA-binding transcriptional repressor) of toxin-antitoxin stability system
LQVSERSDCLSVAAFRPWAAILPADLLYNVHMGKYTVSMVRERLAEALDDAERGEPVYIERRGVTYELTVRKAPIRRKKATRQIDILDKSIVQGNWTWAWEKDDLRLRTRRS